MPVSKPIHKEYRAAVANLISADADGVARAAEVIRSGGIVGFPTETVYGLGANALDANASAKIFAAKQRPHFDPLIVHLASADDIAQVVDVGAMNERTQQLMTAFWPGPLTLVLPKRDTVPGIITSGLDTVAVRVPSHPVAHALIVAAGVPVAAPSANRFGSLSPTRAQHVVDGLGEAVDLVIDGGPTTWGVESTIVAVNGESVTVLRLGAITVEDIEKVVGVVEVMKTAGSDEPLSGPGQLAQHYSPDTHLRVIERGADLGSYDKGAIYIAFSQAPAGEFAQVEVLSKSGDLTEAAANLFETLHKVDRIQAPQIIAEWMPEIGLGRAINDRLKRAAARWG